MSPALTGVFFTTESPGKPGNFQNSIFAFNFGWFDSNLSS